MGAWEIVRLVVACVLFVVVAGPVLVMVFLYAKAALWDRAD